MQTGPWTDAEEALMRRLVQEEGAGRAVVARALDRSENTVRRHLRNWHKAEVSKPVQATPRHDTDDEAYAKDQQCYEEMKPPCYTVLDNPRRYVFHLLCNRAPIILMPDTVDGMLAGYTNEDGAPQTVNELARRVGMKRQMVIEILKALRRTHDSIPYTDEVLAETPEDDLVLDLVRLKENRVLVKAEAERWRRVQDHARKWETLEHSILQRLEEHVGGFAASYRVKPIDIEVAQRRHAIIVPPLDFHYGAYADGFETPDAYNREIAVQRLHQCTQSALEEIKCYGRPERIFALLGNDWLHSDTDGGTTTQGTKLDCDGTQEAIIYGGCRVAIEYIDKLRQIAPVTILAIPGNHDRVSTTWLRLVLQAWYRDCEDVHLMMKPGARQYFAYGQTLMGATHGDDIKIGDLGQKMAYECREDWGTSAHHLWFTGHRHAKTLMAPEGCTIIQCPTLAAAGRWEDRNAYMGEKALSLYRIDAERGLTAVLYAPVER
jgi:hypothetical protein